MGPEGYALVGVMYRIRTKEAGNKFACVKFRLEE
jgi:hypothetical protein